MKVLEALAARSRGPTPTRLRARIEAEHAEDKRKVIDAGGLFVLATERHESRRIDKPAPRPLRPPGRPGPLVVSSSASRTT